MWSSHFHAAPAGRPRRGPTSSRHALQLVRRPDQFDVLATETLFGDILSDCAVGGAEAVSTVQMGDAIVAELAPRIADV